MSSNIPLVVPNQEKEQEEGLQKVTPLGEKNMTFHFNHQFILEAVNESIDRGFIPSVTYIAERSGLSRKTVYDHIPYIPSYSDDEQRELIEARRKRLLEKIYEEAVSDSPQCLKAAQMYMKLTEGKAKASQCRGTRIKFGNSYIEI